MRYINPMRLAALLFLLLSGLIASAAYNTLQSSIVVNFNGTSSTYGGGANADGLPILQNSILGRIVANSTLSIDGASLRVQANAGGTTCSGTFFYRCYRQGMVAPTFTAINLSGPNNIASSVFLWSSNSSVNLMGNFTTPGVYVVECYWNSSGNASNSSCSTQFNDNNSGNYFQGYVEYCMTDAFSDGNFSLNPTWTGDTNDFTIVSTSDVSGADAINSQTLRLNAPASNGPRYLSKPESNWSSSQTWSFWIGRRAQGYNNANNVAIWLYGNESNLESLTVDGYRLFIGDNSGVDELRLQSVTNNVPTNIITSATGVANNRTDVGFNVIVRRTANGTWTLHTSVLPTTNGSGLNANSNAFSTATVLQGTATNNSYVPNGLGYMGVVVNHNNNANAIRAFEMDNFYFTGGPIIQCPIAQSMATDASCSVIVPDLAASSVLSYNSQMAMPITWAQSPAAGTILYGVGQTNISITATDARSNTAICQFALNRIDQTPPTFSCPANISANNDAGSCGAVINYNISAVENCMACAPSSLSGFTLIGSLNGHTYFRSNASVSWANANTTAAALGGHLATLTSANESTFLNAIGSHWIGLTDEVIEGQWQWVTGEPFNFTSWAAGEPNNSGNQDYGVVNFSGNNWDDDGSWATRPYVLEFDCVTIVQTAGLPSGSLFPIGTTTNSYTATDAAGNSSNCSFSVTITDNTIPILTCPANLTINASTGACSANVNYATPFASDNCGNCTTASPIAGFTVLGTYNGKAYYISNATANYASARLAAQSQGGHLLTIGSAQENSFVANAVLALGNNIWYWMGLTDEVTEGAFAWTTGEAISYTNWSTGQPDNSANNEDYAHVWNNGVWNDIIGTSAMRYVIEKSCIVPQLTQGLPSGSAFPVGITTVEYTATDASGNSSSCSFTIQINDTTAPTISCPSTQSLALQANCTAVMADYRSMVIANDNCTSNNNLIITQSPAPNTLLSGTGTVPVAITVADASGNVSTCSFNLVKTDNVPPILSCPSNITVNSSASACGAIVNYTAPAATDNCSNCNLGASIAGFTYLGAIGTVGYYISTSSTNYATASTSCINAGGHIAAIGSAAENTFIRNAANTIGIGNYGIGLSDQLVEGSWIWSNSEIVAYTNWNGGEPNNSGNEDFTMVYTNGLWNDIASNLFYILEKPCLNLTQTAGLTSGSSFPIGTTTNTFSASDASGNTSTCSFQVTVLDNTLPVISCPSSITVNAPIGTCSAVVNYSNVTATDNCGNCTSPNPIPGFTLLGTFSGSAYYISTTAASTGAVASLNCSNQGGYLAAISTSAENTFIRNAASAIGFGSYLIGFNDALIEGVFTWTNGQPNGYINWGGGEPNNSGNEDYTQVLTNGLWNDINGNSSFYVLEKTCVPVSRTAGLASGSAFPVGTTVVTHTATDASGNVGSCSFSVTVNEFTPPTIICPASQSLSLLTNCTVSLPDYRSLVNANDNCTPTSSIVLTQAPTPGTIVAGVGAMNIQITATDLSGNSSSCSFSVNKVDNGVPTITCPANQTLYVNNNCQAILPDYTSLVTVSDNCYSPALLNLTQSPIPGTTISGVGPYSITLTVSDVNGNSNSCFMSLMIADNTPPQVVCPTDQTIVLNSNNSAIMPDLSLLAQAQDNCSTTISWTQTPAAGTTITGVSNIVATLTASDMNGQITTCQVNISTVLLSTDVMFVTNQTEAFENDGASQIALQITNPSTTQATTVQVVATGNLNAINNQANYTVVFPAGSATNQNINLSILDNIVCSLDEDIQLTIQSVSGGNSPVIGTISQHLIRVQDDEHVRPSRLAADFELGIPSSWTTSSGANWNATSSTPIQGLVSVQHQTASTNGESWMTTNLDNRSLLGVETVWQLQLDNMLQEPSPSRYFIYYLTADNLDLSQGVNGYAVGVKPATASSPDYLTLWRVQTGNVFVPIIVSSIDIEATHGLLGIRVVRDEIGNWTLWLDQDGGFDDLVSLGNQNDPTFHEIQYSGVHYKYSAATSSMLKLDDIKINQKACGKIYYSQMSGIGDAPIWGLQPIATPLTAVSSAYNSFVIQNGHQVTLNSHFAAYDLSIETGGALLAGEKKVYVYNNMNIHGDYSQGDGFLVFKGELDQNLIATNDLNFKHVVIDNDDHTVHFPANVFTNIQQNKVLCIPEGTLETHDKLVLKSSSIGTASIGEITSDGTLNGRVTMERFIPLLNNYPYGSWVAMGCAAQTMTVADWNDDMITSGFLGSDYPPPYSFTNIQYYDESIPGQAGNGFTGVNNITESLKHAEGYFVYMQTPTQFVDVTGFIQQHDFAQPLSYTNTGHADDGWNLMVNQYPSEIDFRQMALNSNGVASYYLYDAEAANYKVFNGLAQVGTAPQRVAMNQSFFVQAAGPGSYLQYNEKFKSNQGVTWERTLPESGYATFEMSGPTGHDECILYLNSVSTGSFEYTWDARKMMSANAQAVEMALVATDNTLLTIDARNPQSIESEIYMYCKMPSAGTYTFHINEIVQMPFGTCYYIEDLITGETMALNAGSSLSITIVEAFIGNRFVIHTQNQAQMVVSDANCPSEANGSIVLTNVPSNWVTVVQMPDQINIEPTIGTSFNQLNAGEYLVTIAPQIEGCEPQLVGIQITAPESSEATILSHGVATCNQNADGTAASYWSAMAPYHYEIMDQNAEIIASGISQDEIVEWTSLTAQIYSIRLWNECAEQTLSVDLTDPNAVLAGILSEDLTILVETGQAMQTTIYQNNINAHETDWLINGEINQFEGVFNYPFYMPGDYELVLVAHNDRCSVSDTIMIEVQQTNPVDENLEGQITITQSAHQIALVASRLPMPIERMDIFDMNGKLIYNETMQLQSATHVLTKGDWSSGIYSIVLYQNDQPQIHKIFITPQH